MPGSLVGAWIIGRCIDHSAVIGLCMDHWLVCGSFVIQCSSNMKNVSNDNGKLR